MDKNNTLEHAFYSIDNNEVHVEIILERRNSDIIIPDTYENLPLTSVSFNSGYFNKIEVEHLKFGNNIKAIKFKREKYYPKSKMPVNLSWCIRKITVPDSLKKLPAFFLSQLPSNTEYVISDTHPTYKIIDNVLVNKRRSSLIRFIDNRNVEIPDTEEIKIISKTCIANLFNMTGLYITKNIESIEVNVLNSNFFIKDVCDKNNNFIHDEKGLIIDPRTQTLLKYNGHSNKLDLSDEEILHIACNAFCNTKDLYEIVLPLKLKNIGQEAFANCSNLGDVKFNDDLEMIYYGAFNYCSSLQKAILKSKHLKIDPAIFVGCTSLGQISYPYNLVMDKYGTYKSYVLDYPNKCKLPRLTLNTSLLLNLTSIHYEELILDKRCSDLILDTYRDKVIIDVLILDAIFDSFCINDKIIVKNIIIKNSAAARYSYIETSLINDYGVLLNCYVPEGTKEFKLPKEVKTIASSRYCLFNGEKEVDTLILPKEVKTIDFSEYGEIESPLIRCKNLVIENSDFEIFRFFKTDDEEFPWEYFKYTNLVIDVSNSYKYEKEENFLIDKETKEKILPLNAKKYYDSL